MRGDEQTRSRPVSSIRDCRSLGRAVVPNRSFDRYKSASRSHQTLRAERDQLGEASLATPAHFAAVDRAELAVQAAATELDEARSAFFADPYDTRVELQ